MILFQLNKSHYSTQKPLRPASGSLYNAIREFTTDKDSKA